MVLPSAPVAPELKLRVFHREDPASGTNVYKMSPVTDNCEFEFFAPNNPPGQRFLNVPTVTKSNNVATVAATTTGVYLFQVTFGSGHYIVGRLQVHKEFVGWWFGNDSITTARDLDPNLAHAQPSIYAKFNDDAAPGTDAIGDITGHGYVTLQSADTGKVVVSQEDGRLRGIVETETPVNLTGTFPGVPGPPKPLPVRVVDYGKNRNELVPVRVSDVANFSDRHNILFIPEGFTAGNADRELFNKIVEKVTNDLFDKGRHQPFGLLEKSFNVFKAYLPSQDHAVTFGYRITDQESGIPLGSPIPYDQKVEPQGPPNIYSMDELVALVGLPKRGEDREFPKTWIDQKLPDFNPSNVNQKLIDAWKKHRSEGILHARDTVFGLFLGRRLADRRSRFDTPVHKPANDDPGNANLQPFIARLYEFFKPDAPPRSLTPDPRRHSPLLHAGNFDNPHNLIMRFINGLKNSVAPFQPIGQVWVPAANFKPSRGLVALITYDDMDGGTNFNNLSVTANTLTSNLAVGFAYSEDKREMRRTPPATIEPDFDGVTNTVAHEFGHSFNLDDEYETSRGDGKGADAGDSAGDNIARLGFLRVDPNLRKLDPDKVKWFQLQRMEVSSRLLADSVAAPGRITVTVGRDAIGKWVDVKAEAKKESREANVSLRNFKVVEGRQLPLASGDDQFLPRLDIGEINEEAGTLVLTGSEMPASPAKFVKGSTLYLPKRAENGDLLYAVEAKVLEHLKAPGAKQGLPLNLNEERVLPNDKNDVPRTIPGFEAPCRPSTLIGIFEGADEFAGAHYRPAGACKMRTSGESDQGGGEYCFVCKWLIVNRVDPSFHAILSKKFYPKATKKKK
jgi:IgA Peptidase M64